MPYEGAYIGVFRGEQTNGIPYIYLGRSADGIHWTFDPEKIPFVNEKGEPAMPVYAYDPRLVKVEDTYYIIWCQDFYGASIGLAKTTDFKTFTRLENPFVPFNRNAVLFPRKINGMYVMLSRPPLWGHLPEPEPRHGVLGPPPPCDEQEQQLVGKRQDRRRRRPH